LKTSAYEAGWPVLAVSSSHCRPTQCTLDSPTDVGLIVAAFILWLYTTLNVGVAL